MREDTRQLIEDFTEFLKEELGVSELPEIEFVGKDFSDMERTFGQYDGKTIKVVLKGRHPMDVLRTLAHEVVHRVRNHTDGSDGSDDENEANAMAGKFMRKFGQARTDGFGLMPEGWGNPGALTSFFGTSRDGPEGFEVANQGVTRRAPGEGPDSTTDAQEMVATDRMEQPIEIDVVPDGVSRAELEAMFRPLLDRGEEAIYKQIIDGGAYGRLSLTADQAAHLAAVVGEFLDTRRYNKPKKVFADDLMDQLGGKMMESYSGDGEVEQGFERQSMERTANDMPAMHEVFVNENDDDMGDVYHRMKRVSARMGALKKSSAKEKKEHPWISQKSAERIARDHEREGES